MKFLQVIPSLRPQAGGPVEGLIQQGIELAKNGHSVETVCLDRPGITIDARMRPEAVHVVGPSILKFGFSVSFGAWLEQNIERFDVVIVHGIWTYHALCVARAARRKKVPYVVFPHGMLDPWFAREYPLKHVKKWLYWPWAEYRTLRDASFVLFTTAEEQQLARQSFWLYKARERLVGYGITKRIPDGGNCRASFFRRFPHLQQTRNILYLSRIHPKKGCDLLINSFYKHAGSDDSLHLVLAGPDDSAWAANLKAEVGRLGISHRVTFTGMLKGDEKWGAYDAADVFVLPSHQENFGIVVAEALASAVPVLTTYQVNIWREIADAGAGIIRSDTQGGCDEMLGAWLQCSRRERERYAAAAVHCFEKNFFIESITQNLISALCDAATSRQRPPPLSPHGRQA